MCALEAFYIHIFLIHFYIYLALEICWRHADDEIDATLSVKLKVQSFFCILKNAKNLNWRAIQSTILYTNWLFSRFYYFFMWPTKQRHFITIKIALQLKEVFDWGSIHSLLNCFDGLLKNITCLLMYIQWNFACMYVYLGPLLSHYLNKSYQPRRQSLTV